MAAPAIIWGIEVAGFDINWSLAQPVNVGNALLAGVEQGRAMRKEADTQSALSAYATNPNIQSANALIAVDPRLGMQARTQQIEMDKTAQMQAVTGKAVQGDPTAKAQLAGLNPEMWMKLDDRTREKAKQATAVMGQAVLDVSRLPEEQRPLAWASYVQHAEASGFDIPTQYERYSPEALSAAAAEAGTMEKLIKQVEPEWRFSPNGGLVDFNNPQSIEQYGQWMSGRGPGAATVPSPPPGFVIDGGPTPSASGDFR